jgi:hypothetical protein
MRSILITIGFSTAFWSLAALAEDPWKNAIILDAQFYTNEGLNMCPRPWWPYKTLDMSDPGNRAFCATIPKRRTLRAGSRDASLIRLQC